MKGQPPDSLYSATDNSGEVEEAQIYLPTLTNSWWHCRIKSLQVMPAAGIRWQAPPRLRVLICFRHFHFRINNWNFHRRRSCLWNVNKFRGTSDTWGRRLLFPKRFLLSPPFFFSFFSFRPTPQLIGPVSISLFVCFFYDHFGVSHQKMMMELPKCWGGGGEVI